jgi:DNA primase
LYYPDEIIDEVRQGNDIVDVVGQYVHLKRQGANYFGLCPFHNEKSPSFSVSPDKQIFYCFGCGKGGNVITFVMEYENCTFPEAVKELADRAGIRLPEAEYSEEARKKEERRAQLYAVNREAATYYYRMLRSPAGGVGLKYFEDRKLTAETMNRFGLGFANGSSSDLVRHLKGKGFADDLILEAGVAAFDEKRGMHDKFWNRVIFPIQDVQNRVIGFGGRVMGDGKPKYLNSPETPIFDKGHNLYALHLAKRSRTEQFILCEGYMDVISMHQAGFSQAVASLGTSFTTGQALVLKRYAKEVLLAYDSDGAGVAAALRNSEILAQAGMRCRMVDLRPYKDPDEFMKGLGHEEFQKRIDNAENAFFYKLRQAESRFSMSDPASRTDFCREAARELCRFDDDIERENYIKAVAEKYFIDAEALRKMVGSYALAGSTQAPVPVVRPAKTTGPAEENGEAKVKRSPGSEAAYRAQKYLLTWMLESPGLYRQVTGFLQPADFTEGVVRRCAEKFFAQSLQGKTDVASIISLFEEEAEQNEAASCFNSVPELPERAEDRERALRDFIRAVKEDSVQRSAEDADDPDSFGRMVRAKKQLEVLDKTKFTL